MQSFADLDLLPTLKATLAEKGFSKPTDIQARALPALLEGRSLVGVSETGSGKTLAYALPILHQLKTLELKKDPVRDEARPRAVVIVPNRELGEQVTKVFKPFTHETRLRVRSVLGGTTLEIAKRNVAGVFEVLVATPGRLLILKKRKLVDLSDVRIFVIDEADQMVDPGFLADTSELVGSCKASRQLVLFSATVSKAVQALINNHFKTAEIIRSQGHDRLVAGLTTQNREVIDGKRIPLLEKILSEQVKGGTLIFTNTRKQCDDLARELTRLGQTYVLYRGEMEKVERRANLKLFREGKVSLLVSTDLASRGLDIEHVGRVVNYHLPQQTENYIHRVGRTARAGRKGLVVNFVTERDQPLLTQLKALFGKM